MKTQQKLFIALGAVALAGTLLWWFQPWLLIVDSKVSESAPVSISSPSAASSTELLAGSFISHEHQTTGTARIIELADGSRVLRLENFETSNGPDLEVWLSDAAVIEGQAGWFLADDGDYVSLGKLKGNKGDQNYVIPSDLDLSRFSSISIWCVRFSVSFGAAELTE